MNEKGLSLKFFGFDFETFWFDVSYFWLKNKSNDTVQNIHDI